MHEISVCQVVYQNERDDDGYDSDDYVGDVSSSHHAKDCGSDHTSGTPITSCEPLAFIPMHLVNQDLHEMYERLDCRRC